MTTFAIRLPGRILAIFRRQKPAAGRFLGMSSVEHRSTEVATEVGGAAVHGTANGNGNGNGNGHDKDGRERLVKDALSFVPLYDRGGPVSLTPSADGPIATLARIELNARRGDPLDQGLEDPDQLNTPGSP